jgi:hypothetical protein
MKTNWREFLGSIPPAATFDPLNPIGLDSLEKDENTFDPLNLKSLEILKREEKESAVSDSLANKVKKVKSLPEPLTQISNTPVNKVKRAESPLDGLESRLLSRGISIAIDRATGGCILLFKSSDAEIVKHVADVYQPFDVTLTAKQRAELTADLDYYERLQSRSEGQ